MYYLTSSKCDALFKCSIVMFLIAWRRLTNAIAMVLLDKADEWLEPVRYQECSGRSGNILSCQSLILYTDGRGEILWDIMWPAGQYLHSPPHLRTWSSMKTRKKEYMKEWIKIKSGLRKTWLLYIPSLYKPALGQRSVCRRRYACFCESAIEYMKIFM